MFLYSTHNSIQLSLLKKPSGLIVANTVRRTLAFKDGQLWYSRDDNPARPLVPLTDDTFFMEDIPYFRIKVDMEDGTVKGLKGLYDNGREDYSPLDRT